MYELRNFIFVSTIKVHGCEFYEYIIKASDYSSVTRVYKANIIKKLYEEYLNMSFYHMIYQQVINQGKYLILDKKIEDIRYELIKGIDKLLKYTKDKRISQYFYTLNSMRYNMYKKEYSYIGKIKF